MANEVLTANSTSETQEGSSNAIDIFKVPHQSYTVVGSGDYAMPSIHLNTAGKYVSKDIHVEGAHISVYRALVEGNAVTSGGWIDETNSVVDNAVVSGNAVTSGGWIDATTNLVGDGAGKATANINVTQQPSVSVTTSVTGIETTTTNTGYAVQSVTQTNGVVNGSAKATAVGTKTANGYIDSDSDIADDTTGKTATITPSVTHAGAQYLKTKGIAASIDSYSAPSVSVSGTPSTNLSTTTTATNYYITVNGSATNGSVKAKATSAGNAAIVAKDASNTSSATTITPTITGDGTKIYIPESSVTNPTTLPSGKTATTISAGNTIEVKPGYYNTSRYFKAQPSSETTQATFGDVTGGYGVKTAGYTGTKTLLNNIAITNTAQSGVTYTESNAPVLLAADKYLYITSGYLKTPTKISLGTLIPDDVIINAQYLLSGNSAYDKDGNRIVGTMTEYDGSYTVEEAAQLPQ